MKRPIVSPLQEIERAVQERAKAISLDMASSAGEASLRQLIEAEVARWNDDHRRGLREFELADPSAVAERAFRNLAGYGPLAPLLADDDVWEIMINAPDAIFVKRHRGVSGYHDEHPSRLLKPHISNIRRKLGLATKAPGGIRAVHGVGYTLSHPAVPRALRAEGA